MTGRYLKRDTGLLILNDMVGGRCWTINDSRFFGSYRSADKRRVVVLEC